MIIDFHTHIYSPKSLLSVPADLLASHGIVSLCDAGTCGTDDFEDFLTPDEDEDLDNFIIVDEDFEDDSINLDDYKTEEAEAVEEIAEEEIKADADIAVVTVDDEESPDEFEF